MVEKALNEELESRANLKKKGGLASTCKCHHWVFEAI